MLRRSEGPRGNCHGHTIWDESLHTYPNWSQSVATETPSSIPNVCLFNFLVYHSQPSVSLFHCPCTHTSSIINVPQRHLAVAQLRRWPSQASDQTPRHAI
ncbi:hypothetical protein FJTKL_05199 [Diaporthe vaccinii]|uniref:Uncharacterized protein n=1 Tax=Diaporthe vaccinii TaxID=105482 RepID=A0ABR4FEX4_9PEZI